MKKMSKVLLICTIILSVLILYGCNSSTQTGAMVQDITSNGNDVNSSEAGDGDQKEEESTMDSTQGGTFAFLYEKTKLIPGEDFDASVLPKCSDISEVPSCAFDGVDKVYNYKNFELTTHVEGEKEFIYSVYLIDPNLPTPEGLSLGDGKEDMCSCYGDGYEEEGSACIYTRGKTMLYIIFQGESVASIEYRMTE